MLHLQIDIRLFVGTEARVMSEWIDRLSKEREQRRQDREIETRSARYAVGASSQMFDELAKKMKADVNEYATKAFVRDIDVTLGPDLLVVKRATSFPVFDLTLRRNIEVPTFTLSGFIQENNTAPQEPLENQIVIICKRQSDCFFRFKGADYGTADEPSRLILEPVLNRL